MWWHISIIPAFGRPKKEDHREFEDYLDPAQNQTKADLLASDTECTEALTGTWCTFLDVPVLLWRNSGSLAGIRTGLDSQLRYAILTES